jgi:hypothetical protein
MCSRSQHTPMVRKGNVYPDPAMSRYRANIDAVGSLFRSALVSMYGAGRTRHPEFSALTGIR